MNSISRPQLPLCPPQDDCATLTCEENGDAGRFLISRRDISPGQTVLTAAPYAFVFNPNSSRSAMYLAGKAATASHAQEKIKPVSKGTAHKDRDVKDGDSPSTPSSLPSAVKTTTASTWCGSCLAEIPVGTAILNWKELRDTAVRISVEQHAWEEQLQYALHVSEPVDVDDTENGDFGPAPRLQKPARSSKMRSAGYAALKQRLRDAKQAQLQDILLEHRQRLSPNEVDGPTQGCAPDTLVWPTAGLVSAPVVGMLGCSACGVISYCSARCLQEMHAQHTHSGECDVYRRVYPRIMKEYYTLDSSGRRRRGLPAHKQGCSSVVMPGDEPLHWSCSTSEERALEAQALLLAALVASQCVKAGNAAALGRDDVAAAPTDRTMEDVEAAGARACSRDGTDGPAAGVTAPGESIAVPKEVLAIQAARARNGLTNRVELMDDNEELKRQAYQGPSSEYLHLTIPTETAVVGSAEAVMPAGTVQLVRLPRYTDVAQLITNFSVLSKDRRTLWGRYYRRFCKLVAPWLPRTGEPSSGEENGLPTNASPSVGALSTSVSESFFLRLCAAAQCNSFGIFTPGGCCIAFGLYPEASYFNHSCVPNVCRVMHGGARCATFYALRPIRAKEALTICYTDVEEASTAERRRNLLATYRFFCQCKRCVGDATLATRGIHLCKACPIRGYLRPLFRPYAAKVPAERTPLDSDDFEAYVCTTCGHRPSYPLADGKTLCPS